MTSARFLQKDSYLSNNLRFSPPAAVGPEQLPISGVRLGSTWSIYSVRVKNPLLRFSSGSGWLTVYVNDSPVARSEPVYNAGGAVSPTVADFVCEPPSPIELHPGDILAVQLSSDAGVITETFPVTVEYAIRGTQNY